MKDPVFPACLEGLKNRHQASQGSQAKGSTSKAGTSKEGITLRTTLPSVTGSRSLSAPTSDLDEVKEQVHEILDQIFALQVETMQEMGFV